MKVESVKPEVPDITGYWIWRHDGKGNNGDLIIKSDGSVGHTVAWSGGKWKPEPKGGFWISFNGIDHHMYLKEDGKTLVLKTPARNPPSIATFEGK